MDTKETGSYNPPTSPQYRDEAQSEQIEAQVVHRSMCER